MLYWALRFPFKASNRLPGRLERSESFVTASSRSNFKRAERSIPDVAIADNHADESAEYALRQA
jgi:hypothetical protein